jgi:competence protein ComEA
MILNLFGLQINIKKEIAVASIIILFLLAGLAGYLIVNNNKDIIIDAQGEAAFEKSAIQVVSNETSGGADQKETEKKAEEIKVYVVGCVNKQGIVTINKGQLIDDAIRLAGGATKDADLNNINLVYELKENAMLYIKSKNELLQSANTTKSGNEAGKGIKITKDSGGAVVNDNEQSGTANGKVNINTASLSELDTLPGVGKATAQDIISFREKSGEFKSIQDIMKVPRIKESKFASIKDFITVD